MKCNFCGRELNKGVLECPYCHYRLEAETQVLSPNERDTFDGVTIDEDGRASDAPPYTEEKNNKRAYAGGEVPPGFKVRTFGFSSGLLLTLLILGGILALVFFLLPAFLVFAAVGAVVIFLMRLFS